MLNTIVARNAAVKKAYHGPVIYFNQNFKEEGGALDGNGND
jgi:hypothetical protein